MSALGLQSAHDAAHRRHWRGPLAVAAAATLATVMTLSPAGAGPGITCDELYHVEYGKRLVVALRHQGLGFFRAGNIRRNFPWRPDGPPVHPPLGNWLLGWMHHLFDPAPDDPAAVSILSARFAPALALGLLAFLVGLYTSAAESPLAGTVAASATVLAPRVFAHGHLAALDMLTALGFTAAVLGVAWAGEHGGRLWQFALAGCVWGLAVLIRLHGVLVLPPVAVWLLWRRTRKAAAALAVWFAAGVLTLYAGWPWLWLAPLDHLRQFLHSSLGRQAIHVFYLGQVWADRDVPRHYALVMFLLTVPLGFLVLGALGIWSKRREWRGKEVSSWWLVLGTLVFVFLALCWPGTPLYDGVRLFLMVFPLWAVCAGVGAKWAAEHPVWRSAPHWARAWTLGVLVGLQGLGVVLHHPCQLSYYNLLVGGLWGAEKLGFEVTYWGDCVREPLLAEAARRAPGQRVFLAPNLAPFQAVGISISSPSLVRSEVVLVGWDESLAKSAAGPRFAVLYNRKADATGTNVALSMGRVVAEYSQQGVWLARLVELRTNSKSPVNPT